MHPVIVDIAVFYYGIARIPSRLNGRCYGAEQVEQDTTLLT